MSEGSHLNTLAAESMTGSGRSLYREVRYLIANARHADEVFAQASGLLGVIHTSVDSGERLRELAIDSARKWRDREKCFPSSEDLFRQLIEGPRPPGLEAARVAEVWKCLPSPDRDMLRRKYELGMTIEQIALAEGRTPPTVARDLAVLHDSICRELFAGETLPHGPEISRLTGQLADGTISNDARVVLETLLLADDVAQLTYMRSMAVIAELQWLLAPPALAHITTVPMVLPVREKLVTAAFVVACVAAIGSLVVAAITRN